MTQIEEQYINRLRKGDDKAYRMLYQQHYDVMCRVAYRYVQDADVAETLVQDCIIHIWEIRETLEVRVSLRCYLLAAVRNRCLNYLEQNQEKREVAMSALSDVEREGLDGGGDWSAPMEERELIDRIDLAIARLPEECRNVFLLSREHDMTYEQIASHTGISVNTVKYHVKNALARLRKELDPFLYIIMCCLIL